MHRLLIAGLSAAVLAAAAPALADPPNNSADDTRPCSKTVTDNCTVVMHAAHGHAGHHGHKGGGHAHKGGKKG